MNRLATSMIKSLATMVALTMVMAAIPVPALCCTAKPVCGMASMQPAMRCCTAPGQCGMVAPDRTGNTDNALTAASAPIAVTTSVDLPQTPAIVTPSRATNGAMIASASAPHTFLLNAQFRI